jgi:diguanylate cyclase (GGDEF)-like protein
LARLGGDEFVVLLTDTSRNAAEIAMNKLLKSVDEYYFETNHGYRVSFSYGIVEPDFNQHVKIEKLLDDADSLMYMHKSQK